MSTTHLEAFDGIKQAIIDKNVTISQDFTDILVKLAPLASLPELVTAINNLGGGLTAIASKIDDQNSKLDTINNSLAQLSLGVGAVSLPHDSYTQSGNSSDALACCLCDLNATMVQLNKAIQYISYDDGLGLDSPIVHFPDPSDTNPPLFTTLPPLIYAPDTPLLELPDGYVAPPGGFQGDQGNDDYALYRCDIGTYIFDYVIWYYDALIYSLEGLLQLLDLVDMAEQLAESLIRNMAALVPTKIMPVAGVNLAKDLATATTHANALAIAKEVAKFIIGLEVEAIQIGFENFKQALLLSKKDLTCMLTSLAKNPQEARDMFVEIAYNNFNTFGMPGMGSGHVAILRLILSDELLLNLWACNQDYDFSSINGYANSNCANCHGCGNADKLYYFYASNATDGTSKPGTTPETPAYVDCATKEYAQASFTTPVTQPILSLCVEVMLFKWGQHSGETFTMEVFLNGAVVYPFGYGGVDFDIVDSTNPEFNVVRGFYLVPNTTTWDGGRMVVKVKAPRPNGCDGVVILKVGAELAS